MGQVILTGRGQGLERGHRSEGEARKVGTSWVEAWAEIALSLVRPCLHGSHQLPSLALPSLLDFTSTQTQASHPGQASASI